ncbi:MAG: LysE family transporter [Saprospiraceae bacterium]|nr:LysE family transporter [Saprospiraceae bacterium]
MEPLVKGLLSGLAYGLLIGPLFFMNIRTTLTHGMRHGVALVAGAFTSDSLLVLGSWWGAGQLAGITNETYFQRWFGLVCGLLLLGFGLSAVWPRKRNFMEDSRASTQLHKRRYTFLQGFSINMSNPSNWLFWLGVATAARAEAPDGSENYVRLFMAAALIALFGTDLSKALLAHQIGRRLKPGVPEKIVRVAGIILIGVSVWILFGVLQNSF